MILKEFVIVLNEIIPEAFGGKVNLRIKLNSAVDS